TAFTPYLFLLHGSDGSQVTSTYGSPFARIPSGDGFFVLPATDTYLIEVTSTAVNVTGAYSVTLADPSTAYGVTGTVQRGGLALSGVTVTFTQVAGTGALPVAVKIGRASCRERVWISGGAAVGER